jgi:hypothetical protein
MRNLFDPGSGMEKIRIRDKRPGSATLVLAAAEFKPFPADTTYKLNLGFKNKELFIR